MISVRLAPLCGVTDHVYRTICFEQECDIAYTEMISAMGYLCAPEQRATRELMKKGKNEGKLILQLFGKDPDIVAEAAKKISLLGIYDGIDLNMGCPARKVACSGEGAGLLRQPELAGRMMEKTVKASCLPVSVKIRIGWDHEHINAIEIARIAESSGISEITVHGRTREQQYAGKADWEIIKAIKEKIKIPVIGNGDIFSEGDAMQRISDAEPDGIMIGRGALGNPWIFKNIKRKMKGESALPVSPEERYRMILHHYKMMMDSREKRIAVREMRKHIGWYLHGFRGAARVRDIINRSQEPEEVFSILNTFFDEIRDESQGDEPC
ncbi:MAG: tRNA dihydrouridine synthase DusB [Clostridia bacterium]|nr:tRNA dihydrouridine synthase DusB [Clostridia bacterium]